MGRFVVLYSASESPREMMANMSSEQMKAGMEAWTAWGEKAGDAIVDFGTPLQPVGRVDANGGASATSRASGYSILQADSKEQVEALLKDHPHLNMPGSSIDVLEVLPVPGS
jgi:hypothetical protein